MSTPSKVCTRCKVRRPLDRFIMGEDGKVRSRKCDTCSVAVIEREYAAAFEAAAYELGVTPGDLALRVYTLGRRDVGRFYIKA